MWPGVLVAWLYQQTAHLGLNAMDEGLMAAYGRRILDGQVPHRDFISPRPVVSALLHLPDFVVPLPLYLAGRLDGIVEVVAFSWLIAWFVFRSPPWEWGPVRTLAAGAATLINLHTFGETAWYTFDGLLFVAAALLMVQTGLARDSRRWVLAGLLFAGLATTTKQSFVPASILILAWLAWAWRVLDRRTRLRRLAAAAGVAVLPITLYLAIISAFGGLSDAIAQLTGGRVVWGRPLFEMVGLVHGSVFGRPLFHGHFPWEVAVAALALLVARRLSAPWRLRTALGAVVVGLTMRLALHQDLTWATSWSLEVMWALALVVIVRIAFERDIDFQAVAVLALGWMAMLSWGYELPALVAGSMCLAVAIWAFNDAPASGLEPRQWVALGSVVAAGVFAFVAVKEIDARRAEPYYDRPASQLTTSVGDVDQDFSGIDTSPAVADYFHGLKRCLARYPAKQVAILPDNPGVYAAMNLDNPFPIDWFWKNDYRGQRGRIVDAALALNARGDYLILFQTVSALRLQLYNHLPNATRHSVPAMETEEIIYDPGLAQALIAALHGRHVVCGSFLGIYQPAATAPFAERMLLRRSTMKSRSKLAQVTGPLVSDGSSGGTEKRAAGT